MSLHVVQVDDGSVMLLEADRTEQGAYLGTVTERECAVWLAGAGDPELATDIGALLEDYGVAESEAEFDETAGARMEAANTALKRAFGRASRLAVN